MSERNTLNLKINELKNLKDTLISEKEFLNQQLNIITKQISSEAQIDDLKKNRIILENQINELSSEKNNLSK